GYLLMASLIFASAFPPMIGYGLYQTLSGYTFGFLIGFPVSYFSALFGAIACFLLSRTFFKHRVTRTLSQYPNLEAAVKAAEKKGFKLFLLIRLSPYPFNLLNVLFAATHLPLSYFAAGTAISLLKIALHVYVGATLTSFVKHVLGNDEDARTEGEIRAEKIKYIFVGLSALLGMGVMIYLYQVVKVAVAETVKLDSAASNEEELSFLHDDDTTEE
ncbi:snare associated Golgi protein-domain-containing protein, partial [Mycotypha africana]|uniref:snare associated Golgi protein-domain-containing protein n=1 Tax=Mycotypha africana TaxID=64632 RepID=UPI002301ABF7